MKEKNVLLFKFRCNIFICVRIIKEMPGSVASGTPCIRVSGDKITLRSHGKAKFYKIMTELHNYAV